MICKLFKLKSRPTLLWLNLIFLDALSHSGREVVLQASVSKLIQVENCAKSFVRKEFDLHENEKVNKIHIHKQVFHHTLF